MRKQRSTMARANCDACKRNVAVRVPRGGDGSGYIYRLHRQVDGVECPNSYHEVRNDDVTSDGWDGRPWY